MTTVKLGLYLHQVIRICLASALLRLVIGLKQSCHFTNQKLNQERLAHKRFPVLHAGYTHFIRVLIGSDFLCHFVIG